MGNILERIVEHKRLEVDRRRQQVPLAALQDSEGYDHKRHDLCRALEKSQHFGLIAEFKRKSPSQDDINLNADATAVAQGYAQAGAAAISCLTDAHFFGARPDDITRVRAAVDIPIIRKDFLIDRYQLHEARAMGADAVLLIATALSAQQIDELAEEANTLGLQVICEVHDETEVGKISPSVDIIGVNNRNLTNFKVDISNSLELEQMLPPGILRISESGIDDPQSVVKLRRAHFQGFLIGTHFMRQADPGAACARFIQETHKFEAIYKDAIA
ncbi:indole-3-glycerol phosphate synthase [Lewinella marina]|uniref:indole-3-glycerol-phosphate synthase n=1 Tax=Neolewinella marina TaxID=438751 RepID=A0A2G0CF61_9BACT|nr:indole-3-glycerol phosphate synthase TrpC [Neolewinella marina]NJB85767.1 indole-3-glycerol phosphate synthase [Neolewinella marina]PHK98560.1 indole-3-glycerol phosphate synthase [Neolewinella marina]